MKKITIEKILFFVGCLIIAAGVLSGIYQWKNEFISVVSAVYTIITNIIIGFLIIGFSTLISLIKELIEVNRKTNSYLDYFKVKPMK